MIPGISAATTLAFDPVLDVAGVAVRLQTIALAGAILLALLAAAWSARRASLPGLARLRSDDLLFLAVAAVPGAIVGGRIAHVLAFLDYYRTNPEGIADPARGGLSLLGAVLGGCLTAGYMATLLDVPARRWADAAAAPLLLCIALGKAALVLGGEGQGLPYDGTWAVAFSGPGPWFSPVPAVPAHPAQLYEAAWAVAGLILVLALGTDSVTRRLPARIRQTGGWTSDREARGEDVAPGRLRFGLLLWAAVAWFLLGRVVVGFAWRDRALFGALGAEQVMALVVLGVGAAYVVLRALDARLRRR
jgi:prolipoprotein diacylglyceryltransferase